MAPPKISFALSAPQKAPRKRPRSAQRALQKDLRKVQQLTGCFDASEDASNQADNDDLQLPGIHNKHPRLRLEDAAAKVKRLQDEGNTLAEAGRYRAAMARWMEAVEVDPQNAVLYELLAQACMALYEDFRAIQFALKATELDPSWGEGFHTLARCQLNYGELELAFKHINKVRCVSTIYMGCLGH
jgi:tetratricopeptide (TPR) repeat protein